MAKKEVEISFKAGSQIVCKPDEVIASKRERDSVEWECVTGQPFTVDFGKDSPFPDAPFHVPAKTKKDAQIPANAPEKTYKYSVSLTDPKTGLVHVLDPTMIIRP